MDNEKIGVGVVQNAISKTEYLVPNLNSGDKAVSWDGNIEVYKKPGNVHKKEDLAGLALVQIKGKKAKMPFGNEITYPVEVAHLRNYLSAGGTVFFVVYFDQDGENETIYYNCLLPYDLKRLIKDAGANDSKSITLRPFPKSAEEKAEILLNFIRDRQLQYPSISADEVTLESLVKSRSLTGLSFGYTSVSDEKPTLLDLMLKKELYLYADLPLGMSYPVEHITNVVATVVSIRMPVIIGEKEHYSGYSVTKHIDDTLTFSVGGSCEIVHHPDGTSKLNFSPKGKLLNRIRDVRFILDAIDHNGFYLSGEWCELNPEQTKKDRKKYQSVLEDLLKTKSAMEYLQAQEDLDMDALTDKEMSDLTLLVASVIDRTPIALKEAEFAFGRFPLANLKLAVSVVKDDNTDLFQIYNFFDAPLRWSFALDTGKTVHVPSCFLLDRNRLQEYNNVNADIIMEQLYKWDDFTDLSDRLVLFMLEVLHAYDTDSKKAWLLDLARRLSVLIPEKDKQSDSGVNRINQLQILRRQRSLNLNEQFELMHMIENPTTRHDLVIAAHVLLNQKEKAKEMLAELPEDQQEVFRSYPIYWFMKDKKDGGNGNG